MQELTKDWFMKCGDYKTMSEISLTLPWPPTANTYYRMVEGRMKISLDGRKYRLAVADQVLIQRGAKKFEGKVSVSIEAWPPDKRRRDLDNLLKPTLDAMTHAGVWLDDSQIDSLSITRTHVGGMLKIKVEALND